MVLGNVSGPARGESSSGARAQVMCHHCGKSGHFKRDCWKLHGKPNSSAKGKAPMNRANMSRVNMVDGGVGNGGKN